MTKQNENLYKIMQTNDSCISNTSPLILKKEKEKKKCTFWLFIYIYGILICIFEKNFIGGKKTILPGLDICLIDVILLLYNRLPCN